MRWDLNTDRGVTKCLSQRRVHSAGFLAVAMVACRTDVVIPLLSTLGVVSTQVTPTDRDSMFLRSHTTAVRKLDIVSLNNAVN
jgi:hypothetical protein